VPIYNPNGINYTGDSASLQLDGPKIGIEISAATAVVESLSKSGSSVPAPQAGFALIDTGASITAVDEALIASLGIQPIGQMKLSTPRESMPAWLYAIRLSFADAPMEPVEVLDVVGCTLQPQGFIALLGRNFLRKMVFVYDGDSGFFMLAKTP
jgi:hypothetical protein